MAAVRIGRQALANLASVAKRTTIYDSELKGFGVRVAPPSTKHPRGSRTFILEYRPGAGGRKVAKKRVTLGSVDVLSPERARDLARDMLAAVRLGADPAEDRAQKRSSGTIREIEAQYRKEHAPVRKSRTATLYNGYWDNHIHPMIGNRLARDLSKRDVLKLHREIGVQHKVTANRVITALSHFYSWAANSNHVPEGFNPCRGVDRFAEAGRERYLNDDELSRLGAAIRKAEEDGVEWARVAQGPLNKHNPINKENRLTRIDPGAAAAIRLLLFTGARLREVLHLRWADYDRQRQLLFLPDSKSGRKTIVLGRPAVEVLESAWERATAGHENDAPVSKYVFPGKELISPKADLKRPWSMITREANLPGLRIHDLRHSFASVGAGAGLGLPIIGRLLGHANPSTTARYAHLDAHPLRVATDLISSSVANAISGRQGFRLSDAEEDSRNT